MSGVPVFPGPYTEAQKRYIIQDCVEYLGISLDTPADEGFLEVMIETLEAGEYETFEQAYDMLQEVLADHAEDEEIDA